MENKNQNNGWGGARPGAGRKARGEFPKNTMLTFRVSEPTARRIKALRELTCEDSMPFVDMLEAWVAEMAKDYGIE
jgi:hypothetical protein